MNDIEDARQAYMAKLQRHGDERATCQTAYIASLSDEELALACKPFRRAANKRLTGRENPDDLKPTPRCNLIRLRWRIWHEAGEPGKSFELTKWEERV